LRKRVAFGVVLLCPLLAVIAPRSAHADGTSPALELDLRAGYALPGGNLSGDSGSTKGLELGNTISGQVPLAGDIGVRIAGHWYLGGYFSYGIALLPKDSCASGVSCSAHDIRFGVDVGYHVLPNNRSLDPWFAIGAGYEILGGSESADQRSVDFSFGGFEYGHLEAGIDLPRAQVGPFVMASVGEYGSASLAGTSVPDLPTAMHSWFELGMRGYFDVWLGPHYDADPIDDDHGDGRGWNPPPPAPPAPSAPLADVLPPTEPPVTASLAAPVIFPPGVHMADRSQCSLQCSAEEQPLPPAAAARVESPMRKHLAALRGCSLDAGRTKESPPITVVFDTHGVGHAQLHLDARSESMRACVSRFPASPTLSGPPGATWQCEDVCN
jgi:hypothetical protein